MKGPKPLDPKVRLYRKIDKNGTQQPHMETRCWKWLGAKYPTGYGQILYEKRMIGAHRLSYIVHIGPIPDGKYILHSCDNPECCNPEHLFIGSAKDNSLDMVSKNRQRKNYNINGELNPSAKLTEEQVLSIRKLGKDGMPRKEIANLFNVSLPLVEKILAKDVWKHI